jgi:hypothetical protein
MDFSFWGFVKDDVYIPSMPVDLQEICERIVNTLAVVDANFLDKQRDKLEYRLDVCCSAQSSAVSRIANTVDRNSTVSWGDP